MATPPSQLPPRPPPRPRRQKTPRPPRPPPLPHLVRVPAIQVCDVWSHNLEEEVENIKNIVPYYPYVAMTTKFPGIVVKIDHLKDLYSPLEFEYFKAKLNVNVTELIQLGLTFFSANGDLPPSGISGVKVVWQFNFRQFDPTTDIHDKPYVDILRSYGINFNIFSSFGVGSERFRELFMMDPNIIPLCKWVTFDSKYDWGYMLKMTMTTRQLPDELGEFKRLIRTIFPTMVDVKHVGETVHGLHGELEKMAELVGINEHQEDYQAGSDSLLIAQVFWRLKIRSETRNEEIFVSGGGVISGL